MTTTSLTLLALAAFMGIANAQHGGEQVLVFACLGITIVGILMTLYVAYRRPEEVHVPIKIGVSHDPEERCPNVLDDSNPDNSHNNSQRTADHV